MSETLCKNRIRGLPPRFKGALFVTTLALCVFVSAVFADVNRQKRSRQPVRAVTFTYSITQADQVIGNETFTRTEYDDNSLFFKATAEMNMTHGADITTSSELLLEEQSHYPLEYHVTRNIKQATVDFVQETDITMVSNVAVIHSVVRGTEQSTRMVLPTGTAILDMNSVFPFYQPLYWYNKDIPGVQSFNVLDPLTKSQYSASLRYQEEETLDIAGVQVQASRYEYTRGKLSALISVDADGRIVRVEQGFMIIELTDWSEADSQE
jgi:hypothetical protein